jgi:hypothetical protein
MRRAFGPTGQSTLTRDDQGDLVLWASPPLPGMPFVFPGEEEATVTLPEQEMATLLLLDNLYKPVNIDPLHDFVL